MGSSGINVSLPYSTPSTVSLMCADRSINNINDVDDVDDVDGMNDVYNVNNVDNVGISDILSSDNSALDKFIENKLKDAGHSLNEQHKLNIMLNPNKETIIQKNQGAILLR